MNCFARTALMASVLVMPLAACSSFDPTDVFDNSFFNPKKPMPGDRKPLFPDGTPGVTQGVPADLYKGYQAPTAQTGQNGLAENGKDSLASTQPAGRSPDAPEEEPKAKPKPKPRVAAAPPPKTTPTAVTVGPSQSAAPSGSASPWPAPPQPQGQAAAPNPGGGQNIWPDPPAPSTYGH